MSTPYFVNAELDWRRRQGLRKYKGLPIETEEDYADWLEEWKAQRFRQGAFAMYLGSMLGDDA
jgi:hypothetical protein